MEGRILLKDCAVFRPDGRVRPGMSVLVEGQLVTKVAPDLELPALPGDWVIGCRGRLLRPGLVDCHAHLANGLAWGASGADALSGYARRFERRLAIAQEMTAAEVEALTAHALAQGLRRGVTLHLEHLLAPGAVHAALSSQARAAVRLGARLVVSHASTGFVGEAAGLEQVDANASFAQSWAEHGLVRGALGLCDSFNCSDALLARVAADAQAAHAGAHFHLGESDADLTLTQGSFGRTAVERFAAHGLLRPGNVAAFARRLDRAEADALSRSRTVVAWAPLSGAVEGEDADAFELLLSRGVLAGLASAGLGTVWEQVPLAFAACAREGRGRRLLEPDAALAQLLFGGPAELCTALFGVPSGSVEPGAVADLAVCDLVPALPAEGSQGLHLLPQLWSAPVAWTLVGGQVVVREGQLLPADAIELAADAARAQAALWRRVAP